MELNQWPFPAAVGRSSDSKGPRGEEGRHLAATPKGVLPAVTPATYNAASYSIYDQTLCKWFCHEMSKFAHYPPSSSPRSQPRDRGPRLAAQCVQLQTDNNTATTTKHTASKAT